MSAQQAAKRVGVILAPIVWFVRDAKTTYGMMGSIKAFSIHDTGTRYRLDPRLPDRKGLNYEGGEFGTLDQAKGRAEEIREEWHKLLEIPYEGVLKRAS